MIRTLTTSAAVVLATVGIASAATLNIVGGDSLTTTADFDPAGTVPFGAGTGFQNFMLGSIVGNGLFVDGPATVRVTFLGKEAGFTNSASSLFRVGDSTITTGDSVGVSLTYTQASAGLLDFSFRTDSGGAGIKTITNGVGASDGSLDLGFTFDGLAENGSSVFALFGDGGNGDDQDYDDMVVRIDVAAIPVPAAGILLVSALGGLALMRRRKST